MPRSLSSLHCIDAMGESSKKRRHVFCRRPIFRSFPSHSLVPNIPGRASFQHNHLSPASSLLHLAHSVNELIVALTKMLRSLCLQAPLILLSIGLFSRPATPLTYWVDSSCAAYPSLNAIFTDMKYMAATVLRRHNMGSNDRAFQWAFYNILKVQPGDSTIFTLPGSYTGTAAEIVSCESLIDVVCRRPARLTNC